MRNKRPTLDVETIGVPVTAVDASGVQYREFAQGDTYELRVLVIPEPEGDYFARAIRLPDVFSHGETIEEAIANVTEVFWDTIRTSLDSNEAIPWQDDVEADRPKDALERWILVDVSKPLFPNPDNEALKRIAERKPPAPEWYENEDDCRI